MGISLSGAGSRLWLHLLRPLLAQLPLLKAPVPELLMPQAHAQVGMHSSSVLCLGGLCPGTRMLLGLCSLHLALLAGQAGLQILQLLLQLLGLAVMLGLLLGERATQVHILAHQPAPLCMQGSHVALHSLHIAGAH